MNGFEKRAGQIKQKIMTATLDMLRTNDPKRVRIADIAKTANVSQVTIYNYFGSKETLIREAFKSYVDKSIREFEEFMNEDRSFKEKIAHITFLERRSFAQFPPRVIKELLSEDPELARYVEQVYKEKSVPLTVRMLQDGKERGEISEEISIDIVLAFMQLYMNQYDTILAMAQQSGNIDRFLEGLIHMFFYGVCGKP